MAELVLRVRAEYQDAVKCREELKKVEAELKNLSADASPEKIKALTKQYTDLYTAWENRMSNIGKIAAYTNEGLRSIGKIIKDNTSEMSGMGKTLQENISYVEKRLDLEKRIRESLLEQGRSLNDATKNVKNRGRKLESEKQEIVKRNGGVDESTYSEEDRVRIKKIREEINENRKIYDDILLKSQVYKQLIIDSDERVKELKVSLQELNKQKIDETPITEFKKKFAEARDEVIDLQNKIETLTSEKKTIELEVKKHEQVISGITDDYDQKMIDNATRYREQANETERLTGVVDGLISKKNELQAQEESLLKTEEEQKQKVTESTNSFYVLLEQLNGLTEGTEEYEKISKQANEALAESITNEEALKGTQDSIVGVRSELNGLVNDILKAQKKLDSSKEKETELMTEHDNIQKIIDNGYEDIEAYNEAIENKKEANQKLAEKNQEIFHTVELIEQSKDGMRSAENIIKTINESYKGFAESIDSQATKVFFDESDFKR